MIWKVSVLAVATQFRTKVTLIINTPLQAHSYGYIHVTKMIASLRKILLNWGITKASLLPPLAQDQNTNPLSLGG